MSDFDIDCIQCARLARNKDKITLLTSLIARVGELENLMRAVAATMQEYSNYVDRMTAQNSYVQAGTMSAAIEILYHNLDEYMPWMMEDKE